MSYLNAPQTELLATHCAACGRPLVDAVSVETGMGPDCRARLLIGVEVDEVAREEANKLVHGIATNRVGVDILEPLARLRALGFEKLANRIQKRVKVRPVVVIEEYGSNNELSCKTPYKPEAVAQWRRVRGWRYSRLPDGSKRNIIPMSSKREVWDLLRRHYKNEVATGPKGLLVIR